MLTIIHGDDTTASRNYYLSLRQQARQPKVVEGAQINPTELIQVLSGNGLVGDAENILIEDLFSKRKSSKDIEEIIDVLNTYPDTPLVLWESKELSTKNLSRIKKAFTKQFKIPTVVFAFLESMHPGNGPHMLSLYHELLIYQEAQYVLFMLIRHIRMLLAMQD